MMNPKRGASSRGRGGKKSTRSAGSAQPAENGIENGHTNVAENGIDDDDDDEGPDGMDTDNFELPPKQDPGERRRIRHEYREVMQDIQENAIDLANPENDDLKDKLDKTEQLFSNVKMTREAALDSHVLVQISQLGRQKAQALHTNFVVFQPVEFAEKLVSFLTGESMETDTTNRTRVARAGWVDLGKAVQTFFRRSPPLKHMYGSFEPGEPKEKERKIRRAKNDDDKTAKVEKPKELENFQQMTKKETTTEEVERILGHLTKFYNEFGRQPICFIEFVTNPTSFGQTIENIFYVSFLVRDGYARVTYDHDNLPVIEPVERAEGAEEPSNLRRSQVVLPLTMKEWQTVIETFRIESPLIPTRDSVLIDEDDENNSDYGKQSPGPSIISTARRGKGKSLRKK